MKQKTNGKRIIALLGALILLSTYTDSVTYAADSNGDSIDDNLVVSFAAARVQSFPESDAGETETISEIDFDTDNYGANLADSTTIQARRLYGANANTLSNVGTGTGTLSQGNAVVWGGAGGTGQYITAGTGSGWTLSFSTAQRYIGLWWSAGNSTNYLQLQDSSGTDLLSPNFSTGSITAALLNGNSCPGTRPTAAQIQSNSWMAYCGNPVLAPTGVTLDNTNSCLENNQREFRYCYVDEPYAFIHIRLSTGFNKVKVWGTGFELDNLTFSETIPTTGSTEETVGTVAASGLLPSILVADPRATSITLPSASLSGSNNVGICFEQVSNSSGVAITGNATLAISRNSTTSGVTENISTNRWKYSGSRADVGEQIPELRVAGVSNAFLVTTSSKWLRIRLTHDENSVDCTSSNPSNVTQIVEIRPLKINSSGTASISIE